LTGQPGGEGVELRPQDLSQEIGRALAVDINGLRELGDLAGHKGLGPETLLSRLIPKNSEVWAGDHGINDFDPGRLERRNLGGEVARGQIESAGVDENETYLGKCWRHDLRQCSAVGVVRPENSHFLVRRYPYDGLVRRFPNAGAAEEKVIGS
jgi:hypothetical protein